MPDHCVVQSKRSTQAPSPLYGSMLAAVARMGGLAAAGNGAGGSVVVVVAAALVVGLAGVVAAPGRAVETGTVVATAISPPAVSTGSTLAVGATTVVGDADVVAGSVAGTVVAGFDAAFVVFTTTGIRRVFLVVFFALLFVVFVAAGFGDAAAAAAWVRNLGKRCASAVEPGTARAPTAKASAPKRGKTLRFIGPRLRPCLTHAATDL